MMKLSKKVLAAFSVAAMLAVGLSFTACGEDDDENEMIQGSGNNKTIDYYNDSTTNSSTSESDKPSGTTRGYSSTALKHQGELVRFCLTGSKGETTSEYSQYADKAYGGVLGFIWDLNTEKEDNIDDKQTKRNFWILGLAVGNDGSNTSKVRYYISRYFNVTDISAKNFGAESKNNVTTATDSKISAGTICELVHTNFTELTDTTDGKLYIWADIYPTLLDGKTHTVGKQDDKDAYAGGWSIDFYKADENGDLAKDENGNYEKYLNDTITISNEQSGYTAATVTEGTATPVPENYMAVYANVYNGKRVTGEWYLKSDYHFDEVVEE